MPETTQVERVPAETGNIGVFFSPEGVMMMIVAITIDVLDFFTASLLVVDLFAIVIIGGWTLWRSGQVKVTKRAGARMAKVAKWAKRLRWIRPLFVLIEFIPVIGMLPLWTILVYLELKYS